MKKEDRRRAREREKGLPSLGEGVSANIHTDKKHTNYNTLAVSRAPLTEHKENKQGIRLLKYHSNPTTVVIITSVDSQPNAMCH